MDKKPVKMDLRGPFSPSTPQARQAPSGIDQSLLDACDIIAGEQIGTYNVTSSARLSTYAVAVPPGSGRITLNDSAARHAALGVKGRPSWPA